VTKNTMREMFSKPVKLYSSTSRRSVVPYKKLGGKAEQKKDGWVWRLPVEEKPPIDSQPNPPLSPVMCPGDPDDKLFTHKVVICHLGMTLSSGSEDCVTP